MFTKRTEVDAANDSGALTAFNVKDIYRCVQEGDYNTLDLILRRCSQEVHNLFALKGFELQPPREEAKTVSPKKGKPKQSDPANGTSKVTLPSKVEEMNLVLVAIHLMQNKIVQYFLESQD